MKSFIQTLKNIYKIEELRSRILFTLLIILIYRLGSKVVLPGVDPDRARGFYSAYFRRECSVCSICFQAGHFPRHPFLPWVSCLIFQLPLLYSLLTIAVPYFQRMQKEGESGRRKMNQITRYLTVLVLILQAPAYLTQIPAEAKIMAPSLFLISSIVILTAGTIFVMWLGERITDKGIGNGISLIIMIGIIARLAFCIVH